MAQGCTGGWRGSRKAGRALAALGLAAAALLAACGGGGGGGAPGGEGPPPPALHAVGGTLEGLGAGKSLALANVDAGGTAVQSAVLSANGRYHLQVPAGTAYDLRVQAQPAGQTCTVSNGRGTVAGDVGDIAVRCTDDPVAPQAHAVAGTLSGLGTGTAVVLVLQAEGGAQELRVAADGAFAFAQPVTGGYTVEVRSQPLGRLCTVAGSQGVAGEGPGPAVACVAQAFRLGGTLAGNLGRVALRNTVNGDVLSLGSNGSFTFAQPVPAGGRYEVVVREQSGNQQCVVSEGAGTADADVTGIRVQCAAVDEPPPPPPAPVPPAPTAAPAGLTVSYAVKAFRLAWSPVAGATGYRVHEDPDGAGPAAAVRVGGTVTAANFTRPVDALLPSRIGAQYTVQACNAGGCGTPTAALAVDAAQAIGYFKAHNTGAHDQLGWSVAISADGTTLAVGAPGEGSSHTGTFSAAALPPDDDLQLGSGAVYVYVRTGSAWSLQAFLKPAQARFNQFGTTVQLSADGNTLAVGAPYDASAATQVGGDPLDESMDAAGAAYVFRRAAGAWSQEAYVKASNPNRNDRFGSALALSGDGATLAVGTPFETNNRTGTFSASALPPDSNADFNYSSSGAAYVYGRSGSTWALQSYIKAFNARLAGSFGYSVALSHDGTRLAVGAVGDASSRTGTFAASALPAPDSAAGGSGAAYLYARSGTDWALESYVKAVNTRTSDRFGTAVSLSGDGLTLAVSASFEDATVSGTHAAGALPSNYGYADFVSVGAAYVYARSGAGWVPEAYLKASNPGLYHQFGASLALSADGSVLAVGAPLESSGTPGLSGPGGVVDSSGAAYLFRRAAGQWSQAALLKAPYLAVGMTLGTALALSGDGRTLAAGVYAEEGAATGIGTGAAAAGAGAVRAGAVFLY